MKKRACLAAALTFGLVVLAGSSAGASTWDIMQPWRIATEGGFTSFWLPSGQTCQNDNSGRCEELPASGGEVYTADYAAAYEWEVFDATDGEVVGVSATEPDGTVVPGPVVTYHSTSNEPGRAEWTDQYGNIVAYEPPGFGEFISGILQVNCGPVGNWSMSLSDNGSTISSTSFTLGHGSPFLSISSPTDNELFDLDENNYTATGSVPYIAGTNTTNPVSWSAVLNYKTSGGYGITFDTLPSFGTVNNEEHDETYQSEGGQVQATASTTASDGSTVNDCVTFYVDGPQTGIPNATITGQLDGLYQGSNSYPTDRTGQYPPTPNLMTGVAEKESMYAQFETPEVCPYHPDLWDLYANYGILAKWPEEPYVSSGGVCTGTDGGTHIGLMQMATTFPDAWDWTTNASDAVNLFSGTTKPNKIQLAATYANDIIKGDSKSKPPIPGYSGLNPPVGSQLENMALVLYGGWLVPACGPNPSEQCTLDSEYYIPYCSGTQGQNKQGNLTCSTGWQWAPNNANQPGGIAYVSYIRSNLQ
jgi:hypothetical protein